MNKKIADEEKEEEQQQTMLVGKRRNGKKKSSQRHRLCLEKRKSRRRRRKRNSKNIIIDQNQKHRNVSNGGRHQRPVRTVSSTSRLPPLSWLKQTLKSQYQSKHQSTKTCRTNLWQWSSSSSTNSTILLDHNRRILFHPRTSSSTQVILANQPLPSYGKHYWEIYVPAVYGTSMMFGIATKQQQLSSNSFTNLLGIDEYGWALSHHGLIWHNGLARTYLSQPIETLKPVLIGLEFDADARTLAYTINNQSMGIAFQSIPSHVAIYPAVSSTSAQSTMILEHSCRLCTNLREICLKSVEQTFISKENLLNQLLPRHLYEQLIS